MAGSLYFSEVGHLEPCVLCWYQRIAMYALAVILVVAAVPRDARVRPYAVALAGIGACISAYHILVQRLPGLPSGSCSVTAPCSAVQVEVFGVITIPVLALIGFLSVLALVTVVRRARRGGAVVSARTRRLPRRTVVAAPPRIPVLWVAGAAVAVVLLAAILTLVLTSGTRPSEPGPTVGVAGARLAQLPD